MKPSSAITSSASASTCEDYQIDETYYFEDLYILVEGFLYKLPRKSFVNDSQVFRDMFTFPSKNDEPTHGSSKQYPLHLDGIKKDDFVQLLRILFPENFNKEETLSINEWASVLKLATMWEFEMVRAKAIANLYRVPQTNPILAITLSKECRNCENWLKPALLTLARRDESITELEVGILGLTTALQIMKIRDQAIDIMGQGDNLLFTRSTGNYTKPSRANVNFDSAIKSVFGV